MSPNDDIIYEYPSVYDQYKDEDWYLWFGSHDYSYDEEIDEEDYVPIQKIPKNPLLFVQVCAVSGMCIGLTIGYLILWGGKTYDFLLVNPITRHELHFPGCPFDISMEPTLFRGILIFSHSLSGWVFVIAQKFSFRIAFYLAGEEGGWEKLFSYYAILDLHAFKEKIYQISFCGRLYEVRLDLNPILRPLGLEDCMGPELSRIEFLSSGQNLCVVGLNEEKEYIGLEVDVDKMKHMSLNNNDECKIVLFDPGGFKTIKVRGRVIIKKGNLMQWIQIWMQRVQGASEANSRTSFFKWGRMMRNVEAPMTL